MAERTPDSAQQIRRRRISWKCRIGKRAFGAFPTAPSAAHATVMHMRGWRDARGRGGRWQRRVCEWEVQ